MKMRRNTSKLLSDPDAIPALMQNMPDFDSIFDRHTPEEVDAMLDGMLSGDNSAENRSRETRQYKQKSEVDKAFNDLMAG
jgi:uncharacterized protein YdcH (DUF465 family)